VNERNQVTIEPFVMSQQVRPRHCDAQAMVYAGRYHEFCEDAFIGWLEHLDVSYASLRALDVDLVISESRYSYRRAARLDDELLIAVTGEMATESTLTARFSVRRGGDLLATAVISYVAVHDGHRCQLPEPLRRLIPRAAPDAEPLLDALHKAQAALYGSGDTAGVQRLLDPEVVWRVPGHNLIAGTYHGAEEVIGYMLRRRELANATFRMHRREVLVGPSQFAALTDGTAERHGVSHQWSAIGLYRARNGRIVECTLIPLDPAAFDAAWR
jgi:YbgC/YbaW family acyl-CoA thioester hydrolase